MVQGAAIQLSGLYEPSSEKISRLLSALISNTRLASGKDAFKRPEYSAEQSATIIRTRHYPTMIVVSHESHDMYNPIFVLINLF